MGPRIPRIERALAAARRNEYGSWIAVNEQAGSQYRRRSTAAGDGRTLDGMPCGVKDNIDVAGLPTASGSGMPPALPATDAEAVKRLKRAGAVIIGKNAMHEIAYGATGVVSAGDVVQNPRAIDRMPGGSSSGSAAAIAAGDVPFSIGTDTGGSVRVPASLCGVVGLRPTTGSLDSSGVKPLSPSLDTIGVLAGTVELISTVWTALNGGRQWRSPNVDGSLRIGIIVDEHFGLAGQVPQPVLGLAAALFGDSGCTVSPVRLGWLDAASCVYANIVGAEAAWVHRERMAEAPHTFQPATLQRLLSGARIPGWKYVEALRRRDRMREQMLRNFDNHDVLICPTTPITAPLRDELTITVARKRIDVGAMLIKHTVPWSLVGTPSLALPLGRDARGLPTSIQIVGKPGDEYNVLKAAAIVESMSAVPLRNCRLGSFGR